MSLRKPHPIWSTAGSSPAQVTMATVQAQMLSGRYRTQLLCSHWSPQADGCCQLSTECSDIIEDLPHILQFCKQLSEVRNHMIDFAQNYTGHMQITKKLVQKFCLPTSPYFCHFLLDCSSLADVISAVQTDGNEVLYILFHITRTFCYTLHKSRLKILGRWRNFTKL